MNKQKPAFFQLIFLITAFAAQLFYTGEVFTHHKDSNTWDWTPFFTIASLFLLISWIGGMWIYRQHPSQTVESIPDPTHNARENKFLVYALGLFLLSTVIYLIVGENFVVQALWLGSILLFLLPFRSQNINVQVENNRLKLSEWIFVLVLTIAGFILRYWNLLEIPSQVDNDISFIGLNSLKLIQTGNYHWIGPSLSGGLIAYDQLIAWSMRLFGTNQYGVVMSSVLLGTFTLPFLYLLGREIGGARLGMIAMAILTTNYTHIQFSRILFGASTTFFATVAFYHLVRGFRTKESIHYAIGGVMIGVGLLMYESSRVLPVIILLLLVGQWIWSRSRLKAEFQNWKNLILGAVVGFGPNLGFAITNFWLFNGRGNDVMLWSPNVWKHETSVYETTNPIQVLWEQTWRTFLTLHLTGDSSPQFGVQRPMVSALVAALFIFGLAYCFLHIKKSENLLLIGWISLTFVLGGVLSYDPPFFPHLNIVLPAVAIIAGMGAIQIIQAIEPLFSKAGYVILYSTLAVVVLISGWDDFETYYSMVKNNAGPRMRASRFIQTLPPDYRVYLVDSIHRWDDFIFQFRNPGVSGDNFTREQMMASLRDLTKPTAYLLYQQADDFEALEKMLPANHQIQSHFNTEGNLVFISITVAPPNYVFAPIPEPADPMRLPGWWLVTGLLLIWGGCKWLDLRKSHRFA